MDVIWAAWSRGQDLVDIAWDIAWKAFQERSLVHLHLVTQREMNRANGLCTPKMLGEWFRLLGRTQIHLHFSTIVGNGLHLKHICPWPMLLADVTVQRTVGKLGLMSSHIEWTIFTSSIMLLTVHVAFRPVYVNFQVMNIRKRDCSV